MYRGRSADDDFAYAVALTTDVKSGSGFADAYALQVVVFDRCVVVVGFDAFNA